VEEIVVCSGRRVVRGNAVACGSGAEA